MTTIQKRSRNDGPALGQDAFLDVVANLVAIVIILVVIVGSRSQKAIEEIHEQRAASQSKKLTKSPLEANSAVTIDEQQLHEKLDTLQTEMTRAKSAFAESQRLEATIKQSDADLAAMDRNRGKMVDLLEVARAAWAEKQKELDQSAVARAQAVSAQSISANELHELEATRARLEKTPEPIVAVAHLPTPMAKTVFGEEIHFRLKGGRLSVVPIELLIQQMKLEFQRSAVGSREGILESAVGPTQGFVANYKVNKTRELMTQGGQTAMSTKIELVNMTFEPLQEPYGQPIEKIIAQNGSQLDIELAGRDPSRTTITVWVYPDSFGDFRLLKEHLYARGYATAARPLPMDRPISAGPQGNRSQAQ